MIRLDGQVAVITGGSRGIGAAAVKMFAEAGAQVVFSYHRNRAAAERVAKEARSFGVEAFSVRADLRRMKDAQRLIEQAVKRFGRLDVLVASAGIWNEDDIPIEKLSERQWDEMMATNLKSAYSVIHFAVPVMKRQGSGRIIALSSTAGQRGEAFHTHYGASKGGVISLVKGLSTELAPHGILVNCVAPGWVDTDMCTPVVNNPPEYRQVLRGIPLHRFARPEEIAAPILFLASEMASYMTGEIVNVNGGNVLCG